MAREKVQLDAKTAKSIGRQLVERLDDYEIATRDLVHKRDFDKSWDATKALKAIVEKIDQLVGYQDDHKAGWEDAIAELRSWILTNMTDAGWKRLQATRRKAVQQSKDSWGRDGRERKAQILTTSYTAYVLKEMADKYQVDRSELVAKLAHWLAYKDSGEAALKRFAAENGLKLKPEGDKAP